MKILVALIALFFVAPLVHAQTATANVKVNHTPPANQIDAATGALSPLPTTGPNALAEVQIWMSKTPRAQGADVTGTPTVKVAPGVSAVASFSASVGDTIYVSERWCNTAGQCSQTSSEANGKVLASTPDKGVINSVTISIN